MNDEFSLLPIPESMESVLDSDNRLPIQFIPENWGVLVLSDQSKSEYEILSGATLHREWESTRLVHFSPSSTRIPHDVIQASCPNGTVLCIKILSYGRQQSQTEQPSACSSDQPPSAEKKPKLRLSLKK